MKDIHFEELIKKQEVETKNHYQKELSKYMELTKIKEAQEIQVQNTVQILEKEHIKAAEVKENLSFI